jgi:hypothetical protein
MFKQRKIGIFLGMAKTIIGNISPYAGYLTLALVGIMSFYNTIYPLFSSWGIEISFWVFCAVLVLIIFIVAVLEYVFMMPSYYEAGNRQAWDAGGPLQDKITQMEKDISEIKRLIKDGQRN